MFVLSARTIRHDPAWRTFEFCQYAEIGKNLATGDGYETRLIEPMALAYADRYRAGPPGERWPVIDRFPLPSFIVAAIMRVMGPTDLAAACSNGLAVSLLASLSYLLAHRWYGPLWAAALALLLLANPSFYGYFVLLGTPDIWFAFLFLLQLLVWCRVLTESTCHAGWSALLGFVTATCYLTRYNMSVFYAYQLAVLLMRRRWKDAASASAVALLTISPLLAYNWLCLRRPTVSIYSMWNLMDDVGAFDVEPWLYYRIPDWAPLIKTHLADLAHKFFHNLFVVIPQRIWTLWHLYVLIPVACVNFFVRSMDPTAKKFLRWSTLFFGLQLVVFSTLRIEFEHRLSPHHGRYFFWFAPVLLLAAVRAMRLLVQGKSRIVHWLPLILISGQLGFYAHTWWRWSVQNREPIYLGRDPIRNHLAQVIPANRLVASNQPQILAWYCGLKSISLPADLDELAAINRASATPVDFIFLDMNFNCIDLNPAWSHLVWRGPEGKSDWEQRLLQDYEFVEPPSHTRRYLFVLLRRRAETELDIRR
jgi:hypothetical protein